MVFLITYLTLRNFGVAIEDGHTLDLWISADGNLPLHDCRGLQRYNKYIFSVILNLHARITDVLSKLFTEYCVHDSEKCGKKEA
jgi:hypothetical protein